MHPKPTLSDRGKTFLEEFEALMTAQPALDAAGVVSIFPPQLRFGYADDPPSDVELDNLESGQPGSGWGTAVMALVTALADRHEVSIFCKAHASIDDDSDDDASNQSRLVGWYEAHGFTAIHDGGDVVDMVRQPQPVEPASQDRLDRAAAGEPVVWSASGEFGLGPR